MIGNNGSDERHSPTKVLILIPTLHVGGAEMDLVRNLPRIDRARFKIVVWSFLERGNLARDLTDAGIEVIAPLLPPPRAKRFRRPVSTLRALLRPVKAAWRYLRIARTVASYVRHQNVDVVHAVLPNSYVVGAIATALARRSRLVMSRVSLNWYHRKYPLLGLLERRVLHRAVDLVVCNSAAIMENLVAEGIPPAKIRLIPNGIDVGAFSHPGIHRTQAREQIGVPQEALVFSSVANFHPYKGHADLFEALHLGRDGLPTDWVLLCVGDDIDGNLDRLRGLAEELGLSGHLRFLGPRRDVELILRAADIHVSASHTEGFPNNILEAMCASLPVVATAVGGVPEMVIDRLTDLLVPAKSSEQMALALVELAHDPSRRRFMGDAARRLVKSCFTLERSVGALEGIYGLGDGDAVR